MARHVVSCVYNPSAEEILLEFPAQSVAKLVSFGLSEMLSQRIRWKTEEDIQY